MKEIEIEEQIIIQMKRNRDTLRIVEARMA